jgi:Zn-dependent protease/CBS domain-containing protein
LVRYSIKIGSLSGIPIELHMTFILLLIAAGIFFSLFDLVVIVFLFIFVVVHEVSHSLVARHYGISVKKIVLYPIGGVSEIEEIPDNPRVEWRMAFAGPATSLVLGLILLVVNLALPTTFSSTGSSRLLGPLIGDAKAITYTLGILNIFLGAFNLIPAFPMDGGRVLRALLAEKTGFTKATRYASTIGRILGIAMAIIGIFYNIFLTFIGIFVFIGATEEAESTMIGTAISQVPVKDIMFTDVVVVGPDDTIENAMETLFKARYHDAVVEQNDHYVGTICSSEIMKVPKEQRNARRVMDLVKSNVVSFPDESAWDALKKMRAYNLDIMPVAERLAQDKIIGVLTKDSFALAYEKTERS